MGVIELTDMAVATSGNYRHWVEVDGKLLSHTMDPGTRRPIANGIASVSVLASTCMAADAWATAFMVLGAETARKLAADMGMGTIFVFDDGTVSSTI
jgi:thiamine biosynthesis lipoprotein